MFQVESFLITKRNALPHKTGEITKFIDAVMSGDIADYQISAWLMAVCINGLDDDELYELTSAIAKSGHVISYDNISVIDKHSTGGVGDKTTLVLLPLVAACGGKISKLSGMGLGFTGGTIDKLQSIPGINLNLTENQLKGIVKKIGCGITGATNNLAPVEHVLYALRDVTATVSSIPLIVSSILGKKIAGGADSFVFDVKCGNGAFMETETDAVLLAIKLVDTASKFGKHATAIISDMSQPLGRMIGNAYEVSEAIEVLRGEGPKDTYKICELLASKMLCLEGVAESEEKATAMISNVINSGKALDKFMEMLHEQGVSLSTYKDVLNVLPKAQHVYEVKSNTKGYISSMNARQIGKALVVLGGGRLQKDDEIDYSVAIEVNKKIGDYVECGDVIYRIYWNDKEKFNKALLLLDVAYTTSTEKVTSRLLLQVITDCQLQK